MTQLRNRSHSVDFHENIFAMGHMPSGQRENCDGLIALLIGIVTAVIGVVYFAIYGFWNHSAWVYLILDVIVIFLLFHFFDSFGLSDFVFKNLLSSVIVALGVLAVQVGWDVMAVVGYTIASLFIAIMIKNMDCDNTYKNGLR
jgi:hypothetical protein